MRLHRTHVAGTVVEIKWEIDLQVSRAIMPNQEIMDTFEHLCTTNP